MPTYTEAIDAICGQFYRCWTEAAPKGAAGILGYVPEIRWWNQQYPNSPPVHLHWLHFDIRTLDEQQTSFRGTDKDEEFGERFEANGMVLVNFHFSKSTLRNADAEKLMELARKAFIRPALDQCVLFRRAAKRNLAADEDFLRGLVTATWQYDDIIKG